MIHDSLVRDSHDGFRRPEGRSGRFHRGVR